MRASSLFVSALALLAILPTEAAVNRGIHIVGGRMNATGGGIYVLGTATAGSPYTCPSPYAAFNCVDYVVSCPNVAVDETATLLVEPNIGTPVLGAILMMGGGGGGNFIESTAGTFDTTAITSLRTAGYKVLQMAWSANWETGSSVSEGISGVACRPATMIKKIYDDYLVGTGKPLCGVGSSAGNDQWGYSMAYYGVSPYVSAVAFMSGPIFTAIDLGCQQVQCPGSAYGYPHGAGQNGSTVVDKAYGHAGISTDPCDNGPNGATAMDILIWQEDSLATTNKGSGVFYYPNTYLGFMRGSQDSTPSCASITCGNGLRCDCTNAPRDQQLFVDTVTAAGQTLMNQQTATGANHDFMDTFNGAEMMRLFMTNQCVIH